MSILSVWNGQYLLVWRCSGGAAWRSSTRTWSSKCLDLLGWEFGSSGGAHLSGRKLVKSNLFCQTETEIVSWSSSGNKCVKIYDMRRLFCLEVMEIKRRTGNKLKVEEFKQETNFIIPPIFMPILKLENCWNWDEELSLSWNFCILFRRISKIWISFSVSKLCVMQELHVWISKLGLLRKPS